MDGRATLEEVPAFICHRKVTSSAVSTSAAPLRNVALVGHQGNGKTTLAEAMLLHSGAVNRAGRVESGNTVLGSQPEERERHQSLTLGVASFEWKDVRFNLIDTPGYADFLADALAGLRTADVAVFVVDGVSGLAVNDELLWDAAAGLGVPRLLFVNKMDKENASFDATLAGIREHFGAGVEPVELPVGEAAEFAGVADLLTEHVFLYDTGAAVESADLPASIAEREHAEHEHLVEDVVELSDDLLARYLDGEQIGPVDLEQALRQGFAAGSVWPVLCGSATDGIGVDRLLEFLCTVGPGPGDVAPIAGADIEFSADGDAVAFVFKTQADDYVGQVALLKVVSGTLRADDVLVNSRTGVRERMHNLLRIFGSKTTAVDTAIAGDIVGAIKLSDVATGDTLAPVGSTVTVAPLDGQSPVYGVAVAAQSTGDEDKLAIALHELERDDPSLRVTRNDETHQRVLEGAGDVHVSVALARVKRRFGIEVDYRTGPGRLPGNADRPGGDRGPAQEAERRTRPVRRGAGAIRTLATRRRLRVHRRDPRWRDPQVADPGGRQGHRRIDGPRRQARIPARRPACRRRRRQTSFRRLRRTQLQDGGGTGTSGCRSIGWAPWCSNR